MLAVTLILAGTECQVHARQVDGDRDAVAAWYTLDAEVDSPGQTANDILRTASLLHVREGISQPANGNVARLAPACRAPCWQFFGEFLYLRPGDDKVSYAVPINGAIVPPAGAAPVQVGPEGIVDISFESGFRVGLARALSAYSSVGASYTHFESNTADTISQAPPFVLRSLVHHPGTANAATDFLQADATHSIDFRLADLEYRRLLSSGTLHDIRYVIGARYGHLEQDFQSIFTNAVDTEIVESNIEFDGGGIRFGLEGERRAGRSGWLIYARGNASFLGGEFTGSYTQGDAFGGNIVTAGWADDRIVSIIDAEIGVGWTCHDGRLRFTAGYLVSAWGNLVTTDDFIGSAQTNNSSDVSDTMTFDGLTSRVEFRY